MTYSYGAESVISNGEGIAMVAFMGIFFCIYLAIIGSLIVGYVLGAIGMYRIAKRRGIRHPWLAWIPIASGWLLGSISDQYQYVANQKVTKRRRIILILGIAVVVLYFAMLGGMMRMAFAMESNPAAGELGTFFVMMFGMLFMFGTAIATMVFLYLAYFDLFRSCRPQNEVVFLVLSIVINITLPFFVFACSKYDLGMPPKREPEAPVQILPAPEAVASAEEEVPVAEEEISVEETTEN